MEPVLDTGVDGRPGEVVRQSEGPREAVGHAVRRTRVVTRAEPEVGGDEGSVPTHGDTLHVVPPVAPHTTRGPGRRGVRES